MDVLSGRMALVTGGSRGIGRAVALAFAAEGADVAVTYRHDRAAADDVVGQIISRGQHGFTVQADVAREDDVARMVDQVMADLGRVDILVNNAGFVTLAPIESMEIATWDEMIAAHLRGTFLVTRLILPGMLERGDGRIINVSSQLGQIGREWFTHYAAAKAGIIGFTRSLAREVSARGVLVNCIAPGPINTGIVPETAGSPQHDRISQLPIPRVGEPEEVAPAAVFLASSSASYFTGQTLGPNGGEVMW